MTESEWLACADPTPMLAHLRGQASGRKWRRVSVEITRWQESGFTPYFPAVRAAFEFADRSADGHGTEAERAAVYAAFVRQAHEDGHPAGTVSCADAAAGGLLIDADPFESSRELAAHADFLLRGCGPNPTGRMAHLLRDIFGNPFRPVAVDPRWLTSTAVALAEAIYAERAFDRLPILADALQDAGCEDAELLGHCRGAGPHVRGCWAVDLVLGKG